MHTHKENTQHVVSDREGKEGCGEGRERGYLLRDGTGTIDCFVTDRSDNSSCNI